MGHFVDDKREERLSGCLFSDIDEKRIPFFFPSCEELCEPVIIRNEAVEAKTCLRHSSERTYFCPKVLRTALPFLARAG